jgi:hypothetical protein
MSSGVAAGSSSTNRGWPAAAVGLDAPRRAGDDHRADALPTELAAAHVLRRLQRPVVDVHPRGREDRQGLGAGDP